MIRANFKLKLGDLDPSLIEKIKNIFDKEQLVEISVADDMGETDYLLSSDANRLVLLKSLKQMKKKELVMKNIEELDA